MPSRATIEGRLTKDPELRFTPNGKAVCQLSVADSEKLPHGEEKTSFFDVTVWGVGAEGAATGLKKGDSVILNCNVKQETWDDRQTGQKRSKVAFSAFVAAKVQWPPKDGAQQSPAAQRAAAPRTTAPAPSTDDNWDPR